MPFYYPTLYNTVNVYGNEENCKIGYVCFYTLVYEDYIKIDTISPYHGATDAFGGHFVSYAML